MQKEKFDTSAYEVIRDYHLIDELITSSFWNCIILFNLKLLPKPGWSKQKKLQSITLSLVLFLRECYEVCVFIYLFIYFLNFGPSYVPIQ